MHDELATKIAALEQLRGTFPDEWVDAQIAALRAQPAPEVAQRIEAETANDNVPAEIVQIRLVRGEFDLKAHYSIA
ncbi:MAG TPA: hypothetical protein PKD53_12655 [Chloroflexaceae bacterium]|nr:hypothetical protein [Chloroflexaceae bacterium]